MPPRENEVLGDASLLVVDEDPDVLRSLNRLLSSCGARISTAPSLAAALSLASAKDFSLILLDVATLGAEPAKAVSRLRSATPPASVLLMTAGGIPRELESVLAMGDASPILKPSDFDDLCARISDLLR